METQAAHLHLVLFVQLLVALAVFLHLALLLALPLLPPPRLAGLALAVI
jgi:hypothetical protein